MSTSALYKTYARADLSFESGEGAWLNGSDGRRYLDFGSGVAVTSLGHAHPHLVETLSGMADKVWHTSNVFRIPEQERLAQPLCAPSLADRGSVPNPGPAPVHAATTTPLRYHSLHRHPHRRPIAPSPGASPPRTLPTISPPSGIPSNFASPSIGMMAPISPVV